MGYLNVDDEFAFHRKVIAAGNAAIGLWVRAGSWSSGQEQDGFVLDDIAKAIGKPREIEALVRTGLWVPGPKGGYIMHDYDDHNITAAEARELSKKRAEAGRKGGLRRPGLKAIKGEASG